MGAIVMGVWTGVGGCVDIGIFLHHNGSGGAPLWVRVVGHIPEDWEDSGMISPSRDTVDDGVDATEEWGRDMEIPSPGGGYGGGRNVVGGYLRCPPSEHHHIIYRDKAHYRSVSGGSTPYRRGNRGGVNMEGMW